MQNLLVAQIGGTFYANIHYGLLKEAKKRGLPTDSEDTTKALLCERSLTYDFHLKLRPIIRQIVGDAPVGAFNFTLSDARERLIRHGGASFSPNTYLVVGDLIHLSKKQQTQFDVDNEPYHNMILDCGLPIDVSESTWSAKAPSIRIQNIKEDSWIAALGYLTAWPETSQHSIRCQVLSASIFDLDPHSETFGSVIPWDFLKKAPADADVIFFPTTFLTLQVINKDV